MGFERFEGRKHFVYVILRHDGKTAYVGCTMHPLKRLKAHMSKAGACIQFDAALGQRIQAWLANEFLCGRGVCFQIAGTFDDYREAWAFEKSETQRLLLAGHPIQNTNVKGMGTWYEGDAPPAGQEWRKRQWNEPAREDLTEDDAYEPLGKWADESAPA